MLPNSCSAFSPQLREELKSAVETCLELSPEGECQDDPHGSLDRWDVSHVTDMTGMFTDAKSFDGDLSKWDVSSVTDMAHLFSSAESFTGDLSKWDVSKVKNMFAMFWGANAFDGDVSKWDVSSVQNMNHMFYKAAAFNGDLSKWDVSSVTTMVATFRQATSFNSDLSNWDVTNVQYMDEMFCRATSFTQEICAFNWAHSKASKIDMFKATPKAISSEICALKIAPAPPTFLPQSKKDLRDAVGAYMQLLKYRQNPQRHSQGDDEVRTALTAAISKATPMWNSGDYTGSTEIYRDVCKRFAAREPLLAAAVVESIDAPINGATRSAGWVLRTAVDVVLQRVDGQEVRTALTAAISTGVAMWNAGDYAGCTKVYRDVCKRFAASEPLLAAAVSESIGAPVDGSSGSAGWVLRKAMDAVLEGRKCGGWRGCGGWKNHPGKTYIEECKAKHVTGLGITSSASTTPLRWYVLNDVVMGGQSKSQLDTTEDGSLKFSGEISLVGGGFATCRTLIDDPPVPLGITHDTKALKIELTGDGQMYKLGLRRSDAFREPNWQAEFNTKANTRTTVVLNLESDFQGSIMGRPIARDEKPDWPSMHSIGITLSLLDVHGRPADKETFHDGPFAITLHSIVKIRKKNSIASESDSVSTLLPDL